MTKDYYDILNRRKPIDRAADAFTGAADQMRPTNNAQRQEANMLRGFGAGLGMSGDFVREQKLKEIEDQAKELSTLDYELKVSSGQNKVRQEKLIGFYNNYRSDLQMANDYLKNGDYDALDMLIPTLSAGYEKATGNKIGKFVGSYNGVVTFDVGGGNYQTMSIKDMMNPLMDVIPENERGSYDAFMNTYQKKDFEIMRQSKQATLDHLLAQNALLRDQGNLYKSQAQQNTTGNINNDKDVKKSTLNKNYDYVEKTLLPKIKSDKSLLGIFNNMNKELTAHPNLFGSALQDKIRRSFIKNLGLEGSVPLDIYKLNSIEFEKTLRPILGGQFGEKEGYRVLGKYISFENNIDAAREYIPEQIKKLNEEIKHNNYLLKEYNKDRSTNLFTHFEEDEEIDKSKLGEFPNTNLNVHAIDAKKTNIKKKLK